jgi:hypothetical protein
MTNRTRTWARAGRLITMVLAVCLLSGCTFEQILIGQWYTVNTPPAGACPSLQWQFAVNPQRMVYGFLSDSQHRIGNLSGRLNPDDSFQLSVTDAAGNQTASVTGRFTSLVSTLSIHGAGAGSACDGQTFEMRLGGYFARQGGGGGGGG